MTPEQVIKELTKRGIPVWRSGDEMKDHEELLEVFSSARKGGWDSSQKIKARFINYGRLLKAKEEEVRSLD